MSGGSPWLMDGAICGVFLSLLVQVKVKRQRDAVCVTCRAEGLGIEMQFSACSQWRQLLVSCHNM